MRTFYSRMRFRLDHRWAPDRFSAHLDGELSPPQRVRMKRHLGECPECRRAFAGLSALVAVLRHLPRPRDPLDSAQFAAAVRVRLGEPPPS